MAARKGDGSIFQRGDTGKWASTITLPTGKRRTFYGDSREGVHEKLKRARANVANNQPVPSVRETVGSFLARWLKDVAAKRVRRTTLVRYRLDVDRRLIPALGRIRLHELQPKHVDAFITDLTAAGVSPRSIQHCRAVLRAALSQAHKEQLVGQNVAKLATVPRQESVQVEALTPDDARAILTAFSGHELGALVTVALATGCRQGELLGLAWDDIDLDVGTLTVRRQLQRIDKAYELVEPKTRQSRRALALPAIAVEALRKHRAVQAERRLLLGAGWGNCGRVFTSATGAYLSASVVSHGFQRKLRKAGLPPRRFHELRHGAASLLLAGGATLRTVMEQLGHSTITLTANTYSHISPAILRDAADRMELAIGGTG